MKVKELFEAEKIDQDFIETKMDGPYWEKAHDFVIQNWTREIESLSEKQATWLTKILDDCVEKRIEG